MKPKILTLISLTILASLLIGAFAFNAFSAPPELKLKVKWKPAAYTTDSWVPPIWYAEIFFAPPRPVEEIDPSTIRLEGIYSPSTLPTHHPVKERLNVPFSGYDVVAALWTKVPHMSAGTFLVWLEITGNLNDGRFFRGSGPINMTIPERKHSCAGGW
jgi:hypothetical protein